MARKFPHPPNPVEGDYGTFLCKIFLTTFMS